MPEQELRFPITARVQRGALAAFKRINTNIRGIGVNSERAASRAIRAFTAFRGSLIGAAGGLFSLKGAIAAVGVGAFVRSIVNAGNVVESAKLRLEGMRGSAEEAAKAFAFFEEVAAAVPFTLEEVIDAGVTLEAFGARAEEALVPVSDLAAFMGTTIPEAARAFGRAFAAGAGAADVLRERGVLTTIKLSEGIEDLTKLTLPEFRKALLRAMSDPVGPIEGAAKRLSKTFSGQVSIMQDSIFKLQKAIAEAGVLEFAKDVINELTLSVKALLVAFDPKNIDDTTSTLEAFLPQAESTVSVLNLLGQAFDIVAISIEVVAEIIIVALKPFALLSDAIGSTTGAAEALDRSIKFLDESINKNVDEIGKSSEALGFQLRRIRELRAERAAEKAATDAATAATERNTKATIANNAAARDQSMLAGLVDKFTQKTFTSFLEQENILRELGKAQFEFSRDAQISLKDATLAFDAFSETARKDIFLTLAAIDPAKVEDRLKAFISAVQVEDVLERTRQLRGGVIEALTISPEQLADTRIALGELFPEQIVDPGKFIEQTDFIRTALAEMSEDGKASILDLIETSKGGLDEVLEKVKENILAEMELRAQAREQALSLATNTFAAFAQIARQGGEQTFGIAKAFEVAGAITAGILATQRALASPPGPPFTIPLAAAVAASTALNVRKIISTRPGGGGGGGGGGIRIGGGGAIMGAPEQAPVQDAEPSGGLTVNLSVAGVIGDEAFLASEMGRIVREAVGDDVEFGLERSS